MDCISSWIYDRSRSKFIKLTVSKTIFHLRLLSSNFFVRGGLSERLSHSRKI
ncbi:hypothetical protein KC19_7G083600 [Ceratodon purpureus]|uniref:Uncharacterized protein n=1 Tax=Ceratodon purpureus TaxID=3225 RepID=A0A8T0H8R4_CERPU|nr:hypothetical protein KC19_7G083600 [Ceratodon purpureus]